MSLHGKRRWFKKWHKWPSLGLSLFILLFASSGILLNHRQLISSLDINREYLPKDYRYHEWNLAAVKSSICISPDSMLIYGNVGVWLTDKDFSRFSDYNAGFPRGIDSRKINTMAIIKDGALYAGTLFGLYHRFPGEQSWEKVELPEEERVVKVSVFKDSLWVLTRSHLFVSSLSVQQPVFSRIMLPKAVDDDDRVSLFRTLWVIHSGELYMEAGRLFVDFAGLVFIFLTLTGLMYFFTPYLLRHMRETIKPGWKHFNKVSLRWHNITGSYLVLILIITAISGMFLRPPLLIAIADARVKKVPFTLLDDSNTWKDKLRDIVFDGKSKRIMIATSEGIYYSEDHFASPLKPFTVQPPVSVMGITVFEKKDSLSYLVGSFSGLYLWQPESGFVMDYLTKQTLDQSSTQGRPIGNFSVAGYLQKENGREIVFDYAHGALYQARETETKQGFVEMPENIVAASPFSLWNLALEVHTCRIYATAVGDFYILLVPVFGLGILFVLVTGFFSWYYKKLIRHKAAREESLE